MLKESACKNNSDREVRVKITFCQLSYLGIIVNFFFFQYFMSE